jgi:hypothetical protein
MASSPFAWTASVNSWIDLYSSGLLWGLTGFSGVLTGLLTGYYFVGDYYLTGTSKNPSYFLSDCLV